MTVNTIPADDLLVEGQPQQQDDCTPRTQLMQFQVEARGPIPICTVDSEQTFTVGVNFDPPLPADLPPVLSCEQPPYFSRFPLWADAYISVTAEGFHVHLTPFVGDMALATLVSTRPLMAISQVRDVTSISPCLLMDGGDDFGDEETPVYSCWFSLHRDGTATLFGQEVHNDD
jgi:hypothetical protein